jgi:chemotaxis protein CheD
MTSGALPSAAHGAADQGMRGMQDGAILIKIDPGEHFVTPRTDQVLCTVLGSCIAACVRDPLAAIGGMNHFMLPASETGEWAGVAASLRYGNFAMEKLINDILRGGGRRNRLEAKIFGGADMVGGSPIGTLNADFVEASLREEGIRIVARHLRGRNARRVHYAPVSGQAFMRELRRQDSSVARLETRYGARLTGAPSSGSVELFD